MLFFLIMRTLELLYDIQFGLNGKDLFIYLSFIEFVVEIAFLIALIISLINKKMKR